MKHAFTYCFFAALFLALMACSQNKETAKTNAEKPKDSIRLWIAKAKDTVSPAKEALLYKAYAAVARLPEDSVKAKHLLLLSYRYFYTPDTAMFRKVNKASIQVTAQIGDSSRLALAYWDLGDYLSDILHKKDSGYYYYAKAQRLYEAIGDDFSSAQSLINMAIEQINVKDNIGAEIHTVKAIQLLLPLKKYRQLYSCYINLGIIHRNLSNYDQALEYYNKALEYLEKTDNNALKTILLNNMGLVHKDQGKYKEAIEKYEKALYNNNLYEKNLKHEALIINNIAYAKFKRGDTTELPEMFYEALKIRDSLNIIADIFTSKVNLAEYYARYKDTITAFTYVTEARELALYSNNSGNLLRSLKLLSKIAPCEERGGYLDAYTQLSDSLQLAERRLRGSFTRIQFETEQLKVEKEALTKDKATFGLFIIALSIMVLIIGFFTFYYYRSQRLYRRRFKTLLQEKKSPAKATPSKTKEKAVANLHISEAALNNVIEKLKRYVEKKKYLNNDVSLNNWARAMQSNPKYLSQVVNFYKQKSFSDYIKDLRIDYTLEELKNNPVFRKYSIKAIAEEVGFNTAESFSKAFYKKTGIYPSYFLKELEKEVFKKQRA